MKRTISAAAVLTAVALLLTGCDLSGTAEKYTEPFKDAPRSGVTWDGAADVITMPDGFNNMATKCGPGGMRYTVTFHHDSPYGSVAVTQDPACKGAKP